MSLLDVALKINKVRLKPFIAPVPDAAVVFVWTVQYGTPFKVRLPLRSPPGWHKINPIGQVFSSLGGPALPREYLSYLENIPTAFHVIAIRSVSETTWLCTPYNRSDAAQRGWADGEPRIMHLVRHSIRPFSVVRVRAMFGVLLYHRPSHLLGASEETYQSFVHDGPPIHNPNFRHAYDIAVTLRDQSKIERERIERETRKRTVEGRLQDSIEFIGGKLLNWDQTERGYTVTWEYNGHMHEARIGRELRLESAGICLDGGENQQTLTSVVAVIEEARRRHRFDMDRGEWL